MAFPEPWGDWITPKELPFALPETYAGLSQ